MLFTFADEETEATENLSNESPVAIIVWKLAGKSRFFSPDFKAFISYHYCTWLPWHDHTRKGPHFLDEETETLRGKVVCT